jgi:hypothetical protein
MIVASSGRIAPVSGHDHGKARPDGETKSEITGQTALRAALLWQTVSVTFGRIIIGGRVGT